MKKSTSTGCAWLLVIFGGIYLMANYSSVVILLLVLLFGAAIVIALTRKTNCQICGNSFNRTHYVWTIEGRRQHVCTHCNQNLQRRNSRDAMRNRP